MIARNDASSSVIASLSGYHLFMYDGRDRLCDVPLAVTQPLSLRRSETPRQAAPYTVTYLVLVTLLQ
jgi:hypothetical protein